MKISGGLWQHRWFVLAVAALLINGYGVWELRRPHAVSVSVVGPRQTTQTPYAATTLSLLGFEPSVDSYEEPKIRIKLSELVESESAGTFIEVNPKVAFRVEPWTGWWSASGCQLVGAFQPGASYKVTLRKGLKATNGATLPSDITRVVSFPDCPSSVAFRTSGNYLSSQGNLLVPVSSINVRKLSATVERVYPNNLVYFATRDSGGNRYYYGDPLDGLTHVAGQRSYNITAPPNQAVETMLDLHEFLQTTPAGAFNITVTSDKGQRVSHLVVVTDIGIAAKLSDRDLTVWANSIHTLAAVTGATVRVFSKTNQKILSGTTDTNGLVRFKADLEGEPSHPFLVTVTRGDELSYLRLDNTRVETGGDTGGRAYLRKGYEAFLFTDRGIYRPGETTHLKAIVRGKDISCPPSFPVQLHVLRPDGKRDRLLTAILNEFGTAEFTIAWPDYTGTGAYRFLLKLPGQEQAIGATSVAVEEFVPPQIAVTMTTPKTRGKASDPFPVEISGRHLFGRPADGNVATVGVEFVPDAFAPADWKGFVFGDPEKSFISVRAELGRAPLDAEGKGRFTATPSPTWRPPAAVKAIIVGGVMETGGRTVSAYASRAIDVYPVYLGLKLAASSGALMVGQTQTVTVVVVTPDGKPVTHPDKLQLTLSKITWSTVLKKDSGNRFAYQSERQLTTVLTNELALANGMTSTTFTPAESGQYLLRVRDPASDSSSSVSFYVGAPDQEWLAWSMETPEHVDLQLDKDRYAVGDEATLVIKAPFAGKALLTIESDHVLNQQVVVLEKNTAQVKIPVAVEFSPNVYCSVSLIRPVQAGEKWAGHRAAGSVPLVIDSRGYRQEVKLTAPKEMRPKERLSVTVETGGPAEIVVAAVDEGICALTEFRSPDPVAYFAAQRRLGVQLFDLYGLLMPEVDDAIRASPSEPGGDASATMLKRRLNPITARRFKPVALWSATTTDPDGKAVLTFDVPEFTGQLRVMAVAVGREKFGSAQVPVLVKRPLVVRSSLPRFLAPGDVCKMPVQIFNDTGQPGEPVVRVTSRSLAVRHIGGDWELKAPATSGVAMVTLDVALGAERYSEEFELAVRPSAARTTVCGSGLVTPGTSVVITPPINWLPGTAEQELRCSGLPGLKLSGGLDYLLRYPYGCLEQTTSSAFPLLYLADLAAQLRPGSLGREETTHLVAAGVQRVLSMQLANGGFSLWPRESQPYEWGSIYATHFLAEAVKTGYSVPKDRLSAACDYLRSLLSKPSAAGNELNLRAYACLALASAGKPEHGWNARLAEQRELLDTSAQVSVAAAFTASGRRRDALNLLTVIKSPADGSPRREVGGCLNSSVRDQALLLATWLELEPGNPIVPMLVQRLESAAGGGHWYTTQENALALVALGKYARRLAVEQKPFQAQVVGLPGNAPLAFNQDKQLHLTNNSPVTVTNAGPGAVYYYWRSAGVPGDGQATELDRGLIVRRRLLSLDGQPLATPQFKQGNLVVVEVTLDSGDAAVDNIVVEDLLPAGLEVENASLATSQLVPWLKDKQTLPVRYTDVRDDRLLVFTGAFSGKRTSYYAARAVTVGDYVWPAISAACMYDSEIRSVHGKGRLQVR